MKEKGPRNVVPEVVERIPLAEGTLVGANQEPTLENDF